MLFISLFSGLQRSGERDSLSQLYEPGKVDFTMETPGWYILGGLFILFFIWFSIRRYKAGAYRRVALSQLDQLKDTGKFSSLEVLAVLKRVAIGVYGRNTVAALEGSAWLEFLDRSGKAVFFERQKASLFAEVYQDRPMGEEEKLVLLQNAKKWIKTHA